MTSSKTYKASAIVLRKTKLGEKDLIVTLLSENGESIRAVAKGARKPGGSFASKLELFANVDAMLAKGRNLDVIVDARFSLGTRPKGLGLEQAACASALAELLGAISQEGLEHPFLYDMGKAAFDAIPELEGERLVLVTAAALMKAAASSGLRPNFEACVSCGREIDLGAVAGPVAFSISDGGMACGSCPRLPDAYLVDAAHLAWVRALTFSRFDEIAAFEADSATAFGALSFARQWCEFHCGKTLKSLDFLLVAGQI